MVDHAENEKSFRARALEQWTDSRVMSAEYLDSVLWFCQHMESQFSRAGMVYRGCVFRSRDDEVLLVVKAIVEGVPSVAFLSGLGTTHCVHRLHRKWEEGTLNWHDDKYAQFDKVPPSPYNNYRGWVTVGRVGRFLRATYPTRPRRRAKRC